MTLRRLLALALSLALVACGGGGAASAPAFPAPPPAASFVAQVDHRYFPIEPGRVWTYEGVELGKAVVEEVRTLEIPRTILGIGCIGVEERRSVDGRASEWNREWFAQDRDGNVWKFGEEAYDLTTGFPVPTPDSWIAGESGGTPWRAFAADPHVGDRFSGYRPDGVDVLQVTSVAATESVPAGFFSDCLELVENPDDPEDTDLIIYGGGVGRLSERTSTGYVHLVATQLR